MLNKNFGSLINREFLFNKLKTSAFNEVFSKKNKIQSPFITVSREPGSGGKLIAERLAKHLNYKFYDKEMITRISKNKEQEEEYENLYDEKEFNVINEFLTRVVLPNLITQDKFVEELTKKVVKLTLKGKCVILGRGANFFTDHNFGFHVRVTAPLDYRIEKTVKYEHLNLEKAKERVKQVSKERRNFVEKYFTNAIDNSEHYDLILNRAHYTLEDAVAIIIHAFKKKMKL